MAWFKRARKTDPATSQEAAQKSEKRIDGVRDGVLYVMYRENRAVTAQEVNVLYAKYVFHGKVEACDWDSPRKRVGELLRDDLLMVVGTVEGRREYVVPLSVRERLFDRGW